MNIHRYTIDHAPKINRKFPKSPSLSLKFTKPYPSNLSLSLNLHTETAKEIWENVVVIIFSNLQMFWKMAQYRHYTNGTSDHVSIGIRASSSSSSQKQQKLGRIRRLGYRSDKNSRGGLSLVGAVIVFLCLVLIVTVLAYNFLSTDNRSSNEGLFWFPFVLFGFWESVRKMRKSENGELIYWFWSESELNLILIELHIVAS